VERRVGDAGNELDRKRLACEVDRRADVGKNEADVAARRRAERSESSPVQNVALRRFHDQAGLGEISLGSVCGRCDRLQERPWIDVDLVTWMAPADQSRQPTTGDHEIRIVSLRF
jgi:hypothetical protein